MLAHRAATNDRDEVANFGGILGIVGHVLLVAANELAVQGVLVAALDAHRDRFLHCVTCDDALEATAAITCFGHI